MTNDELLKQLQLAYPQLNDRELCLKLLEIHGQDKPRQHISRRSGFFERIDFVSAMVLETRIKGDSEYAAIETVQTYATDQGKGGEYVKTLWKRYKKNHPDRLDQIEAKLIADLQEHATN